LTVDAPWIVRVEPMRCEADRSEVDLEKMALRLGGKSCVLCYRQRTGPRDCRPPALDGNYDPTAGATLVDVPQRNPDHEFGPLVRVIRPPKRPLGRLVVTGCALTWSLFLGIIAVCAAGAVSKPSPGQRAQGDTPTVVLLAIAIALFGLLGTFVYITMNYPKRSVALREGGIVDKGLFLTRVIAREQVVAFVTEQRQRYWVVSAHLRHGGHLELAATARSDPTPTEGFARDLNEWLANGSGGSNGHDGSLKRR
jgi:hypothetical protein